MTPILITGTTREKLLKQHSKVFRLWQTLIADLVVVLPLVVTLSPNGDVVNRSMTTIKRNGHIKIEQFLSLVVYPSVIMVRVTKFFSFLTKLSV